MNFSKWQQRFTESYPDIRLWLNLLSSRLAEFGILILAVFVLEVGFLYFCESLWAIYIETQVGQVWMADHQQTAKLIAHVLNQNKVDLALSSVSLALKYLLGIGVLCQVVFLLRFFYLSQGLVNRILFWGLPLSALNALSLNHSYQLGLEASVFLVAFPTLALMHHSFVLASNYIPEPDDLLKPLAFKLRSWMERRKGQRLPDPSDHDAIPQASQGPAVTRLEDDPRRPGITAAICSGCGHRLTYPSKYSGRKVKCRNCENAFALP